MIAKKPFAMLKCFLVAMGALSFLVAPQVVERAGAGSSDLKKVIEGAKKEKILRIQWSAGRLGGDAGIRKMVAAMNKRYGTNVKLQFTPGPNFPKMLNKLTQEKAAGRPASSDIQLGTSNHIAQGLRNGMLRKIDWNSIIERPIPSGANVDRIATDGSGVMIASRIVGITYNTNLVKGDDIPTSMEDVFKPKFKGKIASTPYATGLYQFAAKDVLGYEFMKKYTRRLAKQIGGLFSCNTMERVGSGEFLMLIFDCGHDDALRLKRRGAPLGHATVKEVARVNIIYFGVPKHALHPNAAMLFTNFLQTKEGQALQWKLAGHDLHIYPEAHTRLPVQKVVAQNGKLIIDTVQREFKIGHKEVNRIKREFVKILKKGGV
ncbi:MAG: ABC transporter substrate-binding protein [Candidatus Methylomirabilales bacterium]